jgi:serine/threonine-protein kinase
MGIERMRNPQVRELLAGGGVDVGPPDPDDQQPRRELLGLIGKGAGGEVFLGRERDLRRIVAVKRIDARLAASPDGMRRFTTEAQITAQLDHPAIVPIHALERGDDGVWSYAMKLVRGTTLREYLDEARRALQDGGEPDAAHSLPARLELFLSVCAAMAYAHQRRVIHRDLKPENIMVGAFQEVFVMDWGLAKPIGARERIEDLALAGDRATETKYGRILGSPAYMSPEQAEGRNDELDGRSDQYALGLILFELVTLRRAISASNVLDAVARAAQGVTEPLLPSSPREPLRPELRAIIEKATALEPAGRYSDVDTLAADLRRFLRDEPVLARPDSPTAKILRWVSRHRAKAVALGMTLVLVAVGVALLVYFRGVAALETQRRLAEDRQAAIGSVTAAVVRQANRIDRRLQEFEAILTGIAFPASEGLDRDPPEARFYTVAEYKTAGAGPPDLRPSKVYGEPASFAHPDVALAPGVDPNRVSQRILQLVAHTPYFLRAILASHPGDTHGLDSEGQARLVLDTGVPLVWVYSATEEGVLVGSPGVGAYPAGYDPRERAWYRDTIARGGMKTWSTEGADESGMGLVLTCTVGLFAKNGRLAGVTGIDIKFSYVVENLLEPEELAGSAETYLLDEEFRVVVGSSLKESGATMTDYKPPPGIPAVAPAAAQRATGHLVFEDDRGVPQLAVWNRLQAVPWVYLAVTPAERFLPSTQR